MCVTGRRGRNRCREYVAVMKSELDTCTDRKRLLWSALKSAYTQGWKDLGYWAKTGHFEWTKFCPKTLNTLPMVKKQPV